MINFNSLQTNYILQTNHFKMTTIKEDLNQMYDKIVKNCQKCGGQGTILLKPFTPGVSEVVTDCECRHNYRAERDYYLIISNSNIPKFQIEQKPIENMPETDMFFKIGMFDKAKTGLLVLGAFRTGKTTFACDFLKKCAREGHSVKFWDFSTLVETMWRGEVREGDYKAYDECLTVDILCLDDILSVEREHDFADRKLSTIINTRYNNMLPTVFTTNASKKILSEKMNERTYRRLEEYCKFINI